MKPIFDREPLKNYINKQKGEKPKRQENSYEDIVFTIILSIFLFGIIFLPNFNSITGRAIQESNTDTISLSEYYVESTNLSFIAAGNITSVRITGKVIGDGSARVMLDNLILVDTDSLTEKSGNLITGNVIAEDVTSSDNVSSQENINLEEDIPQEAIENITEESLVENETVDVLQENITDVLENNTVEEEIIEILDETSEQILSINDTIEPEINITEENTTLIENETIINETFVNETSVLNETTPEVNISENISGTTEEPTEEIIVEVPFDDYCLDTCQLPGNSNELNIKIELAGNILYIESITYTYEVSAEEPEILPIDNETISQIENLTANISEENLTDIDLTDINMTELNISVNESLNVSMNVSVNETLNITINETEELLENITIPVEELNLTNETNVTQENITLPVIEAAATELDLFILSLNTKGITLTRFENLSGQYIMDIENRYGSAEIHSDFISDVDIIDLNDNRFSSAAFRTSRISRAEVVLESSYVDIIMKCVQLNEEGCKRWQKTAIPFVNINDTVRFSVEESGMYAAAELDYDEKEFIPANSVYYNSNCEKCEDRAVCEAEKFCVMENKLEERIDFQAQMDFDIFNIREIGSAELCAYMTYGANEPVFNYLKYSPESYCSDIRNGNSTTDIVTYKLITESNGWVCIDATIIVKEAQEEEYSNVFINWIGQDLGGEPFPFICYNGIAPLSECGGYSPSGSDDCRPYLRLSYR